MKNKLTLSQFAQLFPNDDFCMEEIKRLRYHKGIYCASCGSVTKHYKLQKRTAYSCEFCRHQVYPLKGTIFEKSATPLSVWFYCMYLMTQQRGKISVKTLQKELQVTYKTAWRMRSALFKLMKQHNGDLLKEPEQVITVSFFNAFELKVIQKQEVS